MNVRAVLLDAKKAVGCFTTIEATAVGLGLMDNATAGYVTAVLGAVSTALVYVLRNIEKPAEPQPTEPLPHVPAKS